MRKTGLGQKEFGQHSVLTESLVHAVQGQALKV